MVLSVSILLVAPPVLYADTWWSARVASKPHLHSLAGFVRDLAERADPRARSRERRGVPRCRESVCGNRRAAGPRARRRRPGRHLVLDQPPLPRRDRGGSHDPRAASRAADRRRRPPSDGDAVGFRRRRSISSISSCAATASMCCAISASSAARGRRRPRSCAPRRISCRIRRGSTGPTTHGTTPSSESLWLSLSRGCPFKCAYCAEPQRGTSWNHYSVEDALGILETLSRSHRPRVVCFADPLFGANRKWTDALLDGIQQRGLTNMFWCETRADLMTPELLDKFRACRFKVDFGLDTGSETMARPHGEEPVAGQLSAQGARDDRARELDRAVPRYLCAVQLSWRDAGDDARDAGLRGVDRRRRPSERADGSRARASSSFPAPRPTGGWTSTAPPTGPRSGIPRGGARPATTTRSPPTCCRATPFAIASTSSATSSSGKTP